MILTYYCAVSMILIAYLLGSIPNAVWIGKKYYGIDIREVLTVHDLVRSDDCFFAATGISGGDFLRGVRYSARHAVTHSLVLRGKTGALPVFALDVLKGFVAVALLGLLKYDDNISDIWLINLKIIAVFAAVLGHIFPVFAHFKGGKGVATLVGAVLGIHPITVLLCFGIWFIVLMITHYVSLSSMIAGCCFPIFVLLSPKINHSVPLVVFSFVIAALLIWTHRKNIDRLKKGTESKIYIWRPVASRRRNDPDK
jgi:glycerol-3-phosphate acyltransferase PlsY